MLLKNEKIEKWYKPEFDSEENYSNNEKFVKHIGAYWEHKNYNKYKNLTNLYLKLFFEDHSDPDDEYHSDISSEISISYDYNYNFKLKILTFFGVLKQKSKLLECYNLPEDILKIIIKFFGNIHDIKFYIRFSGKYYFNENYDCRHQGEVFKKSELRIIRDKGTGLYKENIFNKIELNNKDEYFKEAVEFINKFLEKINDYPLNIFRIVRDISK